MGEEKTLAVDPEKCIGCEACEGVSREYFKIENSISVVIKKYDEADADLIQEAIDGCPTQAISLE